MSMRGTSALGYDEIQIGRSMGSASKLGLNFLLIKRIASFFMLNDSFAENILNALTVFAI